MKSVNGYFLLVSSCNSNVQHGQQTDFISWRVMGGSATSLILMDFKYTDSYARTYTKNYNISWGRWLEAFTSWQKCFSSSFRPPDAMVYIYLISTYTSYCVIIDERKVQEAPFHFCSFIIRIMVVLEIAIVLNLDQKRSEYSVNVVNAGKYEAKYWRISIYYLQIRALLEYVVRKTHRNSYLE